MTNSPPSNVKPRAPVGIEEAARVLAGGLDRLDLSLSVRWQSGTWFEELTKAKEQAKGANEPAPITVETADGPCAFVVSPAGADGHEWVVRNRHYGLSVGNWLEPKQRPSMSLQVRSETLWHVGALEAVARSVRMIESLGGEVECIKVSRLDLCVDILLHESHWRRDVEDGLVTRARDINPHTQHRQLTGFSIGKNQIMARFYDKPVEIARQSRKSWMFDVWGIDAVPADHRIIRVEFQLRRERVKGLGLDRFGQLHDRLPGIWAYCTQRWLRVVEDASVHHTQEELRPWWPVVRDGFPGAQGSEPVVVDRAVNTDREIVARQALGCLASLVALEIGVPLGPDDPLPIMVLRDALRKAVKIACWNDSELSDRVRSKQAKLWRHRSSDGALDDGRVFSG
ncbi:MAG: replication initiation factor domain-containing protein [bacterium]|nr:replication initiation factor domain-containing protein [bacterium]